MMMPPDPPRPWRVGCSSGVAGGAGRRKGAGEGVVFVQGHKNGTMPATVDEDRFVALNDRVDISNMKPHF